MNKNEKITGIPVELQNSPAQNVEVHAETTENIEMFKVPVLHEIGKSAVANVAVIETVPGVASSEVVISGTPVNGGREKVVLDEYKGGTLDTVPGTEQYADKQEAIANIARSENAINNPNKMQA